MVESVDFDNTVCLPSHALLDLSIVSDSKKKLCLSKNIFLVQYINNHQEEFINFINDPNAALPPPQGGDPSGLTYIRVTPEEQAEIESVSYEVFLILLLFFLPQVDF